jgi:very-short-patch-repair endonuclease
VSVAQALPALLRAKKVVVLGDSKQFSNVKSANASNELNDKYRANLVQFFESSVTRQADILQRLAMFDVKKSILEFCSLAASYSVMLRKHFRSYQELIGYSSSTFYNHQLQAIKIRGVPLDEVICFDQVDVGDHRVTRGTNQAEANFILERLLELVDEDEAPSVGVITPFRDQQTLLSKFLFGHPRGRDFEDRLRLKVMTFDSCQGEERNIIFYSMVASEGLDALNYVFPVSLENAQETVEDKLKVQRLNVGFSRAQEMIWIVHSMPLSQYRGAIGQALNYYANVLNRKDVNADQTDPASPMEAKVLDWLQKTAFVQANIERIEILPQFPIGDYLRQLDPTYRHPAWRVDFLLTYQSDRGPVHVVIEYDGFEHHFQANRHVHVGNHERYLLEADVERQLTLESYGYRFLRVNRFNLGTDPVTTLSDRLQRLVEVAGGEPASAVVTHMQSQAVGLANRELKPCTRCGEIRDQTSFFDPSLGGGTGAYGRVCMPCKGHGAAPARAARTPQHKKRRRWK